MWNRPTDCVAGWTISSGAGPGIMDGLQWERQYKQAKLQKQKHKIKKGNIWSHCVLLSKRKKKYITKFDSQSVEW